MDSKHTPGPWKSRAPVASTNPAYGLVGPDGRIIAWFPIMAHNRTGADLALASAAPDMLAALQMSQTALRERLAALPGNVNKLLEINSAAIAKAEGRQ